MTLFPQIGSPQFIDVATHPQTGQRQGRRSPSGADWAAGCSTAFKVRLRDSSVVNRSIRRGRCRTSCTCLTCGMNNFVLRRELEIESAEEVIVGLVSTLCSSPSDLLHAK